ncbi:MAG: 1,4-dihydroxy-2-naphthoate polyprenyltransferase [Polyangia bacterium]
MAPPLPQKGSLGAWLLGFRLPTLGIAVAPVLVGTAVAYFERGLRTGPALAALVGALLILIGTNLANDVFDYEKGADTSERLGPVRVTQAGLLAPHKVKRAVALAFLGATACGVYLAVAASPWIIALGLVCMASGLAYTGGPYPLGYHGLGDVFVFVFLGLVAVCGTVFVQLLRVPWLAVAASLPLGALATAVLVVNNVRDVETDRRAGKRTLAVRLGRGGGLLEYHAVTALAYAVPLALVPRLSVWALLPLATLPLALRLNVALRRTVGAAMNPLLKGTAQLLLLFGLLWAAGIALSRAP